MPGWKKLMLMVGAGGLEDDWRLFVGSLVGWVNCLMTSLCVAAMCGCREQHRFRIARWGRWVKDC